MMVLDIPAHQLADGLLEEVEEVVMGIPPQRTEKDWVVVLAVHMQVQVMVHRNLL